MKYKLQVTIFFIALFGLGLFLSPMCTPKKKQSTEMQIAQIVAESIVEHPEDWVADTLSPFTFDQTSTTLTNNKRGIIMTRERLTDGGIELINITIEAGGKSAWWGHICGAYTEAPELSDGFIQLECAYKSYHKKSVQELVREVQTILEADSLLSYLKQTK